jgi:hypothetical protein
VLCTATAIESLGDERIGPRHFVGNPASARMRRYRATTPAGTRYLTLQLTSSAALAGALVEE